MLDCEQGHLVSLGVAYQGRDVAPCEQRVLVSTRCLELLRDERRSDLVQGVEVAVESGHPPTSDLEPELSEGEDNVLPLKW